MKFAADENFDNRVLRGLLQRYPDLDVVRIQDTAVASAADPVVLAWAAQEGRILLTHDHRTIPNYAYTRIGTGKTVAGVIIASNALPVGLVIEELSLIVEASSSSEWINKVRQLPL